MWPPLMGDSWGVIATGFGKGIKKSASDARNGATKSDFNPKVLGLNLKVAKTCNKKHMGGFLWFLDQNLGIWNNPPHIGSGIRCQSLRLARRPGAWGAVCASRNGPPRNARRMGLSNLPFGKLLRNYGKSPFLMAKSTINPHFQVRKLLVYQRVTSFIDPSRQFSSFPSFLFPRLGWHL